MNDDVITVGNLVEALKEVDPLMWVCITVEDHVYPMTISNIGVLESKKRLSNKTNNSALGMFFLDIARQSFVKFVENEIINPLMQQAALEQIPPVPTVQ